MRAAILAALTLPHAAAFALRAWRPAARIAPRPPRRVVSASAPATAPAAVAALADADTTLQWLDGRVRAAVADAFGPEGAAAVAAMPPATVITPASKVEFGDYQSNAALPLAKARDDADARARGARALQSARARARTARSRTPLSPPPLVSTRARAARRRSGSSRATSRRGSSPRSTSRRRAATPRPRSRGRASSTCA